MFGPTILARTLSKLTRLDRYGNKWQYHSRSDHHSKVGCWGIIFDLLQECSLLRGHVESGRVTFGINHEIRDFRYNRKKNLDLVLCRPATKNSHPEPDSLESIADGYALELSTNERRTLASLPNLERAPVGSLLLALEAKACMTAHQRALPRLYDELNSSHMTVHGSSEQALAAGFVMVNLAEEYLSPDKNKENRETSPEWSRHLQPRDAVLAIDKVREIPRRSNTDESGYDAICIVVVNCKNDGSPVVLEEDTPAPKPSDIYHYESMIRRLDLLYSTRFKHL